MRSYNEVRQIQIQEHVASRGRLIGENVESGAADDAVLKRLRQRTFIMIAPTAAVKLPAQVFSISSLR